MGKTTRLGSKGVLLSVSCAVLLTASMLVLPIMNVNAEDDTGTLRIAVLQDTPDFNMFNLGTNSVWKTQMFSWAFEGLAGTDIDNEPYPLLAQGWSFYEDTLTVEITLRQGVTFHDGHEMTADDVVFTFNALRSGTVYSDGIIQAFDQNGDYYLTVDEMASAISKTGDNSLVMHMAVPYGQFFSKVLTVPIIPQHIWETHLTADGVVDVFWNEPEAVIGTGPFAYDGGVPGEYRVMTKTDLYWGKDFVTPNGYMTYPPNVDQLYFNVISDVDSAILALESDQVDHIAWPLPADRLPALEDDPAVGIEYMAANGYHYLAFNEKLEPFGSLPFRKAVAHLVDKDLIVDDYLGGLGIVGTTCLPPYWGDWHNEDVAGYEYDDPNDDSSTVPEALLDSAGFVDANDDGWRDLPDGTSMDKITIMTPPADYDPVRFQTGEMIATNLVAVGIDAEVMAVDFETLVNSLDSMEYQMLILGWTLSADPVGNVFDILGPLASTNAFGFWSLENPNPYYEDLLDVSTLADDETQAMADQVLELGDLARSTLDVVEQKALTREAQAIIHDAEPVDVLYYRVNAFAYRAEWTGWIPYLGSILNPFSLSQLERDDGSMEGSVTVVKDLGAPADSAVRFELDPTVDGIWTGVVENDGLKGMIVEVYDLSSGAEVLVSSTRLALGSQPAGTFAIDSVPMVAGASYAVIITPLGSAGGSATLTWYYSAT